MLNKLRLILAATVLVAVQQVDSQAAVENPDGTVSLMWTVSYTPFSWKFSVDPFPIQNASLTMLYEPGRTAPGGVFDSTHYQVISQGTDQNGELANIRFAVGSGGPPPGKQAFIFDAVFDDLNVSATQSGSTPLFTVLAGNGDGFNFPVDADGTIRFDLQPEIPATMIGQFQSLAPVPEPGSGLLILLGTLGLTVFCRHKR